MSPHPSSPPQLGRLAELNFGSNILRNTNGVIRLQGKPQIVIELGDTQILLTMDFYDAEGLHVAHLRRNAWAFNRREQFMLQTSAPTASTFADGAWLTVCERQSGAVVLELTARPDTSVQMINAHFHTHTGAPVELTPHICRIGTDLSWFGDIRECRGGSVIVG
ncbi:MAG: hypothetical protein U0172_13105 [Nitrospiraceae bacterium]